MEQTQYDDGPSEGSIWSHTVGQLEQLVEQYPWFTLARLELWRKGGRMCPELRLRQQLYPTPDFLLKADSDAVCFTDAYHPTCDSVSVETPDSVSSKMQPFDRIDRFLSKPVTRIVPLDGAHPNENFALASITEDPDLISEELAEIYTKQRLYSKANEIYGKLSLLYPEKSVYFAKIIAGFTPGVTPLNPTTENL